MVVQARAAYAVNVGCPSGSAVSVGASEGPWRYCALLSASAICHRVLDVCCTLLSRSTRSSTFRLSDVGVNLVVSVLPDVNVALNA